MKMAEKGKKVMNDEQERKKYERKKKQAIEKKQKGIVQWEIKTESYTENEKKIERGKK